MEELNNYLETIFGDSPPKIVLSKSPKNSEYRRICVLKKGSGYQIEKYTDKQVFHENVDSSQAADRCGELLREGWRQLNAWGQSHEYELSVSKKGKLFLSKKKLTSPAPAASEHNRTKNYIIPEDKPFPALIDMGVFTKEGKVAKPMYDKFRQINRFAEIIDDAVREHRIPDRPIRIIDFGCGKSYLTFVLYHYFTEIRGMDVQMLGLDLKADVIDKCNAAAKRYGYTGLKFEMGDIENASVTGKVNMVVTLHACDTATDYALHNAVMREADMIFSVPCCQHELGGQMKTDNFGILTRYGIIKERTAALCTDAIRANLLEYCGYRTQLLEFIDFEHTPKNILIRAVRRDSPSPKRKMYLDEAEALMKEFSFEPTLYRLLKESGKIG
ncbi:MAG: SAM-dependent methyltransferase [Oscillospiraceae bacterium]|nr:SAM-dependent methyltransferase [Oscillospiraceae bacterium]